MSIENIRRIKELSKMPKEKKRYKIPAKSAKKLKQEAETKELQAINGDTKEQWYDDRMKENLPVCMNCGMEANWLLQPEYEKIWRACQAHILPKRKTQFPSIALHPLNHMVLFPVWGGHLCGDHDTFDSSWANASKMKVWQIVEHRVWELYPLLTDAEKGRLPEVLIKMIECRISQK